MKLSGLRVFCVALSVFLVAVLLAACANTPAESPSPSETPTPTPTPSASPVGPMVPETPSPTPTSIPETRYGVVTSTVPLNLRNKPTTAGDVLQTLDPGTTFEILAEQGTWLQVAVAGQQGYVSSQYVTVGVDPDNPGVSVSPPAVGGTGVVTTSSLRIRNAPSAEGDNILGSLSLGDQVTVAEERSGWYRITDPREGWVSAQYIQLED